MLWALTSYFQLQLQCFQTIFQTQLRCCRPEVKPLLLAFVLTLLPPCVPGTCIYPHSVCMPAKNRRLGTVCLAAAQPDDVARQFLDSINRNKGVFGPGSGSAGSGAPQADITRDQMARELLGEEGYKRLENIQKDERQRGKYVLAR